MGPNPWERWGGGALPADATRADLRHESPVSKIHSLANLAAARASCQPAVAARRSQARRGAHPTHRGRTQRTTASSWESHQRT